MKAELLINERHVLDARTFVEIIIWRLDRPVRGSIHKFKYRLALVADLVCVLRYDNEAGKGDHRHPTHRFSPKFLRSWRGHFNLLRKPSEVSKTAPINFTQP